MIAGLTIWVSTCTFSLLFLPKLEVLIKSGNNMNEKDDLDICEPHRFSRDQEGFYFTSVSSMDESTLKSYCSALERRLRKVREIISEREPTRKNTNRSSSHRLQCKLHEEEQSAEFKSFEASPATVSSNDQKRNSVAPSTSLASSTMRSIELSPLPLVHTRTLMTEE